MNITITASLTEEQIDIISAQKWYNSDSELSKSEFIKNVYESLIINDATNIFIDYSRKQLEETRLAEENAIREQVKASISSSIE